MDFSRNLYEFAFDYAAEGIFQSTPEGKFLNVNKSMAQIYGYESPSEMLSLINDISNQIYSDPAGRRRFQDALAAHDFIERFEAQNRRKDGSLIWTSTNARRVRDDHGNTLYYFGFVEDITARKLAEIALGETETRYRALVEQIPAAVYIEANFSGIQDSIYISPQIEAITGYSPDDWKREKAIWSKLIHADDVEVYRRANNLSIQTGSRFNLEYRIVHKSGREVWLHDMATLSRDADDKPMYWHGVLFDITEQKNVQEALQSSEQRFRKVFESSPIPICITGLERGEFIDANQSYLNITGFSRADLMGHTSVDLGFTTEEQRQEWLASLKSGTSKETDVRSNFKTKHGVRLDVLEFYEVIRLDQREAIVSMFYDMTRQNQAANALRESEEKYRALVENIPAVVFLDPVSRAGGTFYINNQIEGLLGYTAEEWIGDRKLWVKCLHPDDRERILGEENRTLGDGGNFSEEYRLIAKSGKVVWVQEEATLIHNAEGEPLFWQGFLLDITNRKDASAALRQSEERFEKIFHASPLGICITTLKDGTHIDVNDAYCALVEYPREELIGKTGQELNIWVNPDDHSRLMTILAETSSLREHVGRIRTGEGNERELLSFYELVEIGGGPCILSIHFDTSSQQEAQDALRSVAASYRGLFDSVSDAIYILDRNGRFIDINQGAVEMYGRPVDYFLGKTPEDLGAPGRNDIAALHTIIEEAFLGQPKKFEFWGVRGNGEAFPKDVRLSKGMYFGEEVLFALAQDITDKKNADEALRRREAILEAVAFASEQFLKGGNWEDCVQDVLARLGIAGKASRSYIFKNKQDSEGRLVSDQLFEWCAAGISSQLENPDLQNFDYEATGFHFLVEKLANGQVFCDPIRGLDPAAIKLFEMEEILSMLNVPIMVNNTWWGFIGFDECTFERTWSPPEIEALKAAAGILGAVIERSEVSAALVRSEERYRILVEQAADGIFLSDLDGNFLDINQSGCIMLGFNRDEVTSLGMKSIIRPVDLERIPLLYPNLLPGETLTSERTLVRKDGTTFPAEISIKRLANQNIQGIIRDITERRKALDAQERQLKELSILQELSMAGARAKDEDELIEQAIDIIGHTIYTDTLGVLLVTENQDGFLPHRSYRGVNIPDWSRVYSFEEGVTGQVIRSGRPVMLKSVQDFSRYIVFNPGSQSELCVPMKIGERVIGALNAESSQPNHYTTDDERLLLTIAGQLANAIERLRTARAERDQRVLAEALRDTAEALNGTLDFNDVLDTILENIGRVVPSETAMIMLLEGNLARAIRHRGFNERGDKVWIDNLRINCDELADFHRAIESREPQLISDTQANPEWVTFEESKWIRSHLIAPIFIEQIVIGFIALDHNQPGFFTERDKGRLLAFSNQAATALENARLFESERQRRKEAETLREAATVVATTLNSNQAVNLILDQLARVVQFDSASVQLLRDGYLEIVGGRGWTREAEVLGMQFQVPGENPNSIVVLEQRPVIIESTRSTPYPFLQSPHNHILSWLGVPLVARSEVIGMLAVDSKEERHFTEEHIRLVSAFANQAAIAIENARLYEQNEGQIRRLTSLRDIDTAIASSLDLRVTLNILLDQAMAQLQPDAMDILIYNPHLQNLETIATAGFHAPPVRRQSRIGDGLGGTIATTRRMLQITNLGQRPDFASARWINDERFVYYAGVPLLGKGQIKGVLEAFYRTEITPNADWLEFLQTIAGQAAIAIDNAQLFENLQRSNQELSLAYDTTLEGWGKALELRDKETEGHTRRVADLTIQLARRMGIGETEITHIRRGVLLHDIGKMGVPDQILRKGGSLTDQEWTEMKQHPQYAFDLLYPISYLRPSLDIPYCHHERWDGTGYPRGLRGTEIPLSARIFAVVDVWDALLSDRPYRLAWTREQTIEYIQGEASKRFDPRIVQIFLNMVAQE